MSCTGQQSDLRKKINLVYTTAKGCLALMAGAGEPVAVRFYNAMDNSDITRSHLQAIPILHAVLWWLRRLDTRYVRLSSRDKT